MEERWGSAHGRLSTQPVWGLRKVSDNPQSESTAAVAPADAVAVREALKRSKASPTGHQ